MRDGGRARRNGRRLLVAGMIVLVLGLGGVAVAALLGPNADDLGAGDAVVSACDADGFVPTYVIQLGIDGEYHVVSVSVGGIAPACGGGQLSLTLTQGTTPVGSGGPVTVPSGGGSVSVSITDQPLADSVDHIHVVVTGP